jgi:hypothetical protein
VSGSLQLALPKVTSQAIRSVSDLAQARGVKEGLLWFQRERQWINERRLEVCRIPAPTFFEEKRAAWVAAQFRALGCESKIDRAGNVIAWLGSERETPLVALTAHLRSVRNNYGPEAYQYLLVTGGVGGFQLGIDRVYMDQFTVVVFRVDSRSVDSGARLPPALRYPTGVKPSLWLNNRDFMAISTTL